MGAHPGIGGRLGAIGVTGRRERSKICYPNGYSRSSATEVSFITR
jgi:hypothetical protein